MCEDEKFMINGASLSLHPALSSHPKVLRGRGCCGQTEAFLSSSLKKKILALSLPCFSFSVFPSPFCVFPSLDDVMSSVCR